MHVPARARIASNIGLPESLRHRDCEYPPGTNLVHRGSAYTTVSNSIEQVRCLRTSDALLEGNRVCFLNLKHTFGRLFEDRILSHIHELEIVSRGRLAAVDTMLTRRRLAIAQGSFPRTEKGFTITLKPLWPSATYRAAPWKI